MSRLDVRARRIGLSLAAGGLLIVLDTTVTIVTLPAMVAGLDSTLPTLQWVTTGYILGLVAAIPTAGWLANRYGGKRVYLRALTLFVLFSLAAGAAWDAGSLIGFRVAQGLAGGLLNPVGMAIALGATPARQRGAVMSLLGLPVVVGPVLGPPLAGLLVDATSWRWVFWINLPLGALAYLACRRTLPRDAASPAGVAGGRVDLTGLAQVAMGGVLLVLGCTLVGDSGRLSAPAAASVTAGVVLLALFTRHSLRRPDPLVRLDLLRHRSVAAGALVLSAYAAAYFGSMSIVPVFVQGVRGDPVSTAGLLAVPAGIAVGVTLQVATRLVDRVDPRRVVLTGTSVSLAAVLLLGWAVGRDAPYGLVAALGAVLGVGSGATIMPTITTALRGLEGAAIAQGTTLLNLLSQLANALGTAVVATSITLVTVPRLGDVTEVGSGGLAAMIELDPAQRALLQGDLAAALATTYAVPAVLVAVAVLAARRLRPAAPQAEASESASSRA